MLDAFWRCIRRILESRMWGGIAAILALAGLVSYLVVEWRGNDSSEIAIPKEESTESEPASTPPTEPAVHPLPTPQPTKFSVVRRVRCPGGGDWLGRERNKRSARIDFRAPEGRWIKAAKIRVIAKNHGYHGPIRYDELDIDGTVRRIGAHVQIWCDPPDYPGAPGGWMEVSLESM